MRAEQVTALRQRAADGVDLDGLRADVDGGAYSLSVPGTGYEDLDAEGFEDAAREHPAYVTNWYAWRVAAPEADGRRAFLRWLERADERPVPERYEALADGLDRSWGQLHVTVTLAEDSERQYEIRHQDDADVPAEDLTDYTDPGEARQLGKRDERGRYRPLKTAPTLRRGWRFPDLGPEDACAAVDFFYPATVANWYREQAGDLDVTHWRETAERQTGIYDLVDELEGAAVKWLAEACCVDSQCLKRREWDVDESTPLDIERGDGEFPCREPCSLVVAAAREWTLLERERARIYEFELTPSEKEQLEALVDAVADGTVGEIREGDFDEPANRYRARFLRAKLFDDEGNLGGVPTGDDSREE